MESNMLTTLKLVHWKSHEKTEVTFSRGTNVIIGPMGAGKTSLMEALCFALFGTFPAMKAKRVKLEEVIMQLPEKHSDAKVEATLEMDGKKYVIERTIGKDGSKAFLLEGNRLVETGPARVNEAVCRLLKTDYDLFSRAIYAEQNNIDAFLTLGKGERKAQMDGLLGLDKFEKARTSAQTAANRLKAMKGEAERALIGADAAKVEQELHLLEAQVKELATTQKTLAELQKQFERDVTAAREKVRLLDEKQAQTASLSTEIASLQARSSSLNESIARLRQQITKVVPLEALPAEEKRIKAAIVEQENLEKTIQAASAKLQHAQGELFALSSQIERLAEKATTSIAPEELKKQAEDAEKTANTAEKTVEELARKIGENKAAREACAQAEKEKARIESETAELENNAGRATQEKTKLPEEKDLQTQLANEEELNKIARASIMENTDAIRQLESSSATCTVCETPLAAEKALQLLQKKKETLASNEKKTGESAMAIDRIKQQLQALLKITEDLRRLAERQAMLGQALAQSTDKAAKKALFEAEAKELEAQEWKSRQKAKESREAAAFKTAAFAAATELAHASQRHAALANEKKAYEIEIAKARESYSPEKKKQLEQEKMQLDRNAELSALQQQHAHAIEKLGQTKQKLAALGFNQQELSTARALDAELERKAAETTAKLEVEAMLLEEKRDREKALTQRNTEIREHTTRLAQLNSAIDVLLKFQTALVDAQASMRGDLVQAVNETAATLWKSLYPYRDYQSARLNASQDDYAVELLTNTEEWISVDRASGGERTCASLALRVAFAMVLTPSLSWIVLDEPTHNLDANATASLAKTLREDLPAAVEQVFIITHDEALKEGANAAIYKVERDKDKGDKSTVEMISAA